MSLKIMVVDDGPKIPKLMTSLATPLGHMVLPFRDYEAAAQRGETQRFDLIFVGMQLPEPHGIELVRRIRNSDPNRGTVIVMLNTADDITSLRQAYGEGADLVLNRNVAPDRLRRMLAALPEWKGKRHAARLPLFTEVICSWDDRQFVLHSLNISESGMLLRPSLDVEVGLKLTLEFKITEVGACLNVVARIARKEGTERIGVEFIDLAPEDRNAIQLFVTGHLKDLTRPRDLSDIGMRRLFRP